MQIINTMYNVLEINKRSCKKPKICFYLFCFFLDLRPEFNFLTKNLSREWRFYMRALGMEDVEIDSVETDYPQSLKDKIYKSLVLWVKENKDQATKAALIRALRDGSVERNDLASKMEKGNY